MKKIILLACLIIGFASCNKKCNCKKDWDSNVTYVKGNLVKYNGKCWEAAAQGRGIVPGPWMQNGNDIWHECSQ